MSSSAHDAQPDEDGTQPDVDDIQPDTDSENLEPPSAALVLAKRWSTKPVFVDEEDKWLRARIPEYHTTKSSDKPRVALKNFTTTTYHAFCAQFPQRLDAEKVRQARVTKLREAREQAEKEAAKAAKAARLQAGADDSDEEAAVGDAMELAVQSDDSEIEAATKKKRKGRTKPMDKREGDPEPTLLERIAAFYRNKSGSIRNDGAVKPSTRGTIKKVIAGRRKLTKPQVLMQVLGDKYNERIAREYRASRKTKSAKDQVQLVTYRQQRAIEDLKTASPETLKRVEDAWKAAPSAKTAAKAPVFSVDEEDEATRESSRMQRAQYFEDNICMLEATCVKLANDFYAQTGMICNINFVGPRPSLGGKLSVFTFNTHVPGDPRTFSNTYDNYRENVSLQLIEFGRAMYTPAMRSAISLLPSATATPEPTCGAKGGPSGISTSSATATASDTATDEASGTTLPLDMDTISADNSDGSHSDSDSNADSDEIDFEARDVVSPDILDVPPGAPKASTSPHMVATPSHLTSYERQRQENIARNKALLEELGLENASKTLFEGSASSASAARPSTKAKPKPRMKVTPKPVEPRATRSKAQRGTTGDLADTQADASNVVDVASSATAQLGEQEGVIVDETSTLDAETSGAATETGLATPATCIVSTHQEPVSTNHAEGDSAHLGGSAPSDRGFVEDMAKGLRSMVDSDDEPRWPMVVQRYLDLEKKFGYPAKLYKNFQLPQHGRPEEIAWWIGRARVTDRSPDIEDPALYCHTARQYYISLQPEWRQGKWPLPKENVPENESWDGLLHVGRNGIVSLIAMLGYWWQMAEDGEDLVDFEIMLDDLIWVMGELILTGKLKENARVAPDDGGGDRKKRRRR